jgi:hypothetical protein
MEGIVIGSFLIGGVVGLSIGVLIMGVTFTASQQKYYLHRKGDTHE